MKFLIKKIGKYAFLGIILLLSDYSFATEMDSYTMKVALIYNFAKYTLWPEQGSLSAIDFCFFNVRYQSSFQNIEGKKISHSKVRTRLIRTMNEATECEVIFVTKEDRHRLTRLKLLLKEKAILSISDIPGSVKENAIIEIFSDKNKYAFKVNLKLAKQAGIGFRSQVPMIAKEVIR